MTDVGSDLPQPLAAHSFISTAGVEGEPMADHDWLEGSEVIAFIDTEIQTIMKDESWLKSYGFETIHTETTSGSTTER